MKANKRKSDATIFLLHESFSPESPDPVGPTGALKTHPGPPLFSSSALTFTRRPAPSTPALLPRASESPDERRSRRWIYTEESAVWTYYRLTPPRQRRNELARYEGSKAPRQNNNRTQPPPPPPPSLSPATCVQSWGSSRRRCRHTSANIPPSRLSLHHYPKTNCDQ